MDFLRLGYCRYFRIIHSKSILIDLLKYMLFAINVMVSSFINYKVPFFFISQFYKSGMTV